MKKRLKKNVVEHHAHHVRRYFASLLSLPSKVFEIIRVAQNSIVPNRDGSLFLGMERVGQ